MATREEIVRLIEGRLKSKIKDEIQWGDLVSAISSAPQATKDDLLNAVKQSDGEAIRDIMVNLLLDDVASKAKSEASTIVNDDVLTIAELQRIF